MSSGESCLVSQSLLKREVWKVSFPGFGNGRKEILVMLKGPAIS